MTTMNKARWCNLMNVVAVAVLLGLVPLGLLCAQISDPPTPAAEKETVAEEPALPSAQPASEQAQAEPPERPRPKDLVRVGSDVHVKAGDEVAEAVVVLGDVRLDGSVRRDLVVVCGDAEINGTVGGDMVVVMGKLKLGPQAHLRRDVVVVGGEVEKAVGAQIDGQPVEVNVYKLLPNLRPLGNWLRSGLLLGRPLPPEVGWAWFMIGLYFLIYLIIAMLLPGPVTACVRTLDAKALPAFFVGLLGFVALLLLLTILLLTGFGLLLWPFLGLAAIGALLLGKTASFSYVGLQVLRRFNPDTGPGSLLAFLAGSALVCLLYMVPMLGFVAWAFLLNLAFGAVIMAAFAAMQKGGKNGGQSSPVHLQPAASAPAASGGAGSTGTVPADLSLPLAPAPSASLPGPAAGASLGAAVGPAARSTLSPADYATLPRVGFWLRLAATALDFVPIAVLTAKVFFLFPLIWAAYHIGMWSWRGTTVGGSVCGIRVVRVDGRPVDFSVALVRSLASVFSGLVLGIGFFWAGWSAERQAWHDKIAGTIIVKVPKGVALI